ncbi:MAG: helix-turn-helix domain-containing protein [Clostridia bacterium]|nr:helix-turn-helix domain-containing protein [Clostridia bacterium]
MDKGSISTMKAQERLVNILSNAPLELFTFGDRYSIGTIQKVADHLLANGVILPPVTLDEKIKEAARLRYNNGRTVKEIADVLHYSPRTILRFLKRFEEVAKE